MQSGNQTGQYRDGYEGYGRLIQRVGEAEHESCLLLTGREKPREIALMEGNVSLVRSLQITGLGLAEGQAILEDKGLFGTDEAWRSLINMYSGNPLALKLVSEPILDLFGGDVFEFLKKGEIVIGGVHDLLHQQFNRLSELEREIMYWLAIEREAIPLQHLQEDIMHPVSTRGLLGALEITPAAFPD